MFSFYGPHIVNVVSIVIHNSNLDNYNNYVHYVHFDRYSRIFIMKNTKMADVEKTISLFVLILSIVVAIKPKILQLDSEINQVECKLIITS